MLSARLQLVPIHTVVVHSKTVRSIDIIGRFSARPSHVVVIGLTVKFGICINSMDSGSFHSNTKSRRRDIAQPRIAMSIRYYQENSDRHMRLPGIYHTEQTSEQLI